MRALFLIQTNGSPVIENRDKISDAFVDFLELCLVADASARPTASDLLKVRSFFFMKNKRTTIEIFTRKIK